jgi:hypothetical protein
LSIIIYNKLCCFTSILEILVELVNFVNYKVYMDNKNNSKSKEDKSRITQKEDRIQYNQSGIYLRDDHCDWGSSGMNEFTNEYSEDK